MTDMESISKALVIVVQYLGTQRNDEEYTEDGDLKIVEEAASILANATSDEKASLPPGIDIRVGGKYGCIVVFHGSFFIITNRR